MVTMLTETCRGFFTKILERSKHISKCSVFKCVLCSVLINVPELVLKMNVENMHGEKIKTLYRMSEHTFYVQLLFVKKLCRL